MVHFPRRTLITKKRKSNHQYQTINENPNQTFNDSKNTKQTKGFLMQIKIILLKQQANKKHETLNFQSIPDL
jgi:hypothetical protein